MTYRRRAHIAGNVFTSPSRSLLRSPSSRLPGPAMSSRSKAKLWNPSAGIRFAAKLESTPMYPDLDQSRFIHGSSAASRDDAYSVPPQAESRQCPTGFLETVNSADDASAAGVPPSMTEREPGLGARRELDTDVRGEEESEPKSAVTDPPQTSTSFNMLDELFHTARATSPGSPGSFWSHTLYRGVADDGSEQRVKVHYCTSRHSMEYVCQKYFLGESIIGFDLEWHPGATRSDGPRKNVSLIQLATPSRIALFHVALFANDKDLIGPTFQGIMADSAVSKVGVAIQGDCTRLKNNLGVSVRGIFELSHLYKLVKHSRDGRLGMINRVTVSLATQVQDVLRLPLYKGEPVRNSNWMKTLNERQVAYSASDAYAGVQLFYALEGERQRLSPRPPRPHHAELNLPIRVAEPIPKEFSDDDLDDPAMGEALEHAVAACESQQLGPVRSTQPEPKPEERSEGNLDTRDPRIVAAELKMNQYRASRQTRVTAAPSALRAYYIWHGNDDLYPESIAKLLRDPPLQTNTVITYILNAVTFEQLPYSKPRMSHVLSLLHPNAANSPRYQALLRECQA